MSFELAVLKIVRAFGYQALLLDASGYSRSTTNDQPYKLNVIGEIFLISHFNVNEQ
jgi:hypothetical protein